MKGRGAVGDTRHAPEPDEQRKQHDTDKTDVLCTQQCTATGSPMQAPAPEPEGEGGQDGRPRGQGDRRCWLEVFFLGVDGAIGRPAGRGATSYWRWRWPLPTARS